MRAAISDDVAGKKLAGKPLKPYLLVLAAIGRDQPRIAKKMQVLRRMTVIVAVAVASATGASAYTKKVEDACAGDYQNYCSQYAPDTAALRRCFESNRKGLTRTCINALIDAGEVPRRYLKK
jgi:hypothetical protein